MNAPDPKQSGMVQSAQKNRETPYDNNMDTAGRSMLRRDGSQSHLVEDIQLGPKKMKEKVGTAAPFN